MLTTKRPRVRRIKPDWFSSKPRAHLDQAISRCKAEKLVANPTAVASHAFLPLISFKKKERRYRRKPGSKKATASTKTRELAYPANRDGHIFAFYSQVIGALYEAELARAGISDAVIGYRKGACNIRLARDAFVEIKRRGDCVAIALDIKGFFDNIDHGVLKEVWARLLGKPVLPLDHFAVFKALTAFSKIDRGTFLKRLGIKPSTRDKYLPKPLCSIREYRAQRSSPLYPEKLVQTNRKTFGIPQGTPLSAMAANVCMLHFDVEMHAEVTACGGSYRRYSDDILIICAPRDAAILEAKLEAALLARTKTLKLNKGKREEARFALPGPALVPVALGKPPKPLQYLGFTFDGSNVRIRGGTLARYHRRLATGARAAKIQAKLARMGKFPGRDVIHKREVLAKHSHLGKDSFVSRYAKRAERSMSPLSGKPIRRQVAGHMDTLLRKLNE